MSNSNFSGRKALVVDGIADISDLLDHHDADSLVEIVGSEDDDDI